MKKFGKLAIAAAMTFMATAALAGSTNNTACNMKKNSSLWASTNPTVVKTTTSAGQISAPGVN